MLPRRRFPQRLARSAAATVVTVCAAAVAPAVSGKRLNIIDQWSDRAANIFDSTIERFTLGGGASVFASTGLSNPAYPAIEPRAAAVPEPAALLCLGLGGLGVLRRRRTA